MRLAIRFTLLALVTLLATGCNDLLAPIVSTRIEVMGPDKAYGEYRQYFADDAPYTCNYSLTVRAFGATEDHRGSIRFSGANLTTYNGLDVISRTTMSANETQRLFSYTIRPGTTTTSRTFDVASSVPDFRWQIEFMYYDTETGYTETATFKSRCIVNS